jgi:hypothetical protein
MEVAMATQLDIRTDQPTRVLAVADWSVDPEVVARLLREQGEGGSTVFDLLVPARLPGLDWIGDPKASCPCAERQLEELRRMAGGHGLVVERASVGDPERVAAVRTALESWGPDRIVLFDRQRILSSHPLSVARRVARRSSRPVERFVVPASPSPGRRRLRRGTHCVAAGA